MFDVGSYARYTLIKKKTKFSIIYKEIQKRAVAKSYMTNYLRISSNSRKPFLIFDFATAPI
jgi:hypothetical protein